MEKGRRKILRRLYSSAGEKFLRREYERLRLFSHFAGRTGEQAEEKRGLIREILAERQLGLTDGTQGKVREKLLDKVLKECEARELPKGKTVSRETKYEIAKAIGLEVPAFECFKSGEKSYHRISKYLSEVQRSNKPVERYRK